MTPSPQQVAASARAVEGSFLERLAIHADALASSLARSEQLVAWDREQLIGAMQARVRSIAGQRLAVAAEPAVRVIERRGQPLEAIDLAWQHLRRGQRVRLEYEARTCPAVLDLMRGIVPALATGSLRVADAPGASEDDALGRFVGVRRPGPRVALIDADADREMAAYVLARTSLRRSGIDPRAVKAAYVCGATDLLQRYLRRLWVGASIGPATDTGSFAGPIDPAVREEFLAACEQWASHQNVQVWCQGAPLQRSGDDGCYAAPALFFVEGDAPKLPMVGPMLVVVGCDTDQARAGYAAAHAAGGQGVVVGGRPGRFPGARHIRGALLVERLPPGLPEPRPV